MNMHSKRAEKAQATPVSATVFTNHAPLGKRVYIEDCGSMEKEDLPPLRRGHWHLAAFNDIDTFADNCLLSDQYDTCDALAFGQTAL